MICAVDLQLLSKCTFCCCPLFALYGTPLCKQSLPCLEVSVFLKIHPAPRAFGCSRRATFRTWWRLRSTEAGKCLSFNSYWLGVFLCFLDCWDLESWTGALLLSRFPSLKPFHPWTIRAFLLPKKVMVTKLCGIQLQLCTIIAYQPNHCSVSWRGTANTCHDTKPATLVSCGMQRGRQLVPLVGRFICWRFMCHVTPYS